MRFGCHYHMHLNSLGHCICVHQGNISAAAGLKLSNGGVRVNMMMLRLIKCLNSHIGLLTESKLFNVSVYI